jgi:DMSO/TMAO reductase YedYZ molybdopterin-dependent catalytic subunit
MVARVRLTVLLGVSVCALGVIVSSFRTTTAQTAAETAELRVGGAVSTPLTLTVSDLKAMPRTTLHVENPHDKKSEVYEGVLLEELLRRAGAPHGEQLRGQLMTTYVVAEASDGYRVLFSLAELNADFMASEVLVADTVDGGRIDEKRGPFRLIAPHDKRPARWVKMLKSVTVSAPKEMN